MSDRIVLKALASRPKSLSLDGKDLLELPKAISQLGGCLCNLSARNNKITCIPSEFDQLRKLSQLNVGNNELEEVPTCIGHMIQLEKLHLYHNNISSINPLCIVRLTNLTTLNLNDNKLQQLPTQIKFLTSLQVLSVSGNQLTGLPDEVTQLPWLQQLLCDNNQMLSLPETIGRCKQLVKLHVHKNCLEVLPESIGDCQSLLVLDVSGNQLSCFPRNLRQLKKLKELYFENNPLLPQLPVPSDQCSEVLCLRELATRSIVMYIREGNVRMANLARQHEDVWLSVCHAGSCELCGMPYINSWLECIQFVAVGKLLPVVSDKKRHIPIRAPLCSYQCFNSEGHKYYGVVDYHSNSQYDDTQ